MVEVYCPYFSTTLTAAITSATRPLTFSVAATNTLLSGAGAGFSCLIYDVGWDGTPATQASHHVEAIQVTSGGATLSWTGTTETGWSATTHANGSIVVATVLTPRSLTQQMTDHVTTATTPNPHPGYIPASTFSAKGSLVAGTGAGTYVERPVGPDGDILTADSTQSSGMRWASSGVASVLQHMGDLIIGGLLGVAARLPIGSIGQGLVVAQNSPTISNPGSGPTCAATGSGGALVNGTQYDFAFAWQTPNASPDGGITQASPITTFTATSTGVVQVQCGAAPSSGLTLVVYANLHGSALQQQGTLANASISVSNNINVSSIIGGANPSATNTTGGLGPAWTTVGSVTSVGISMPTEFTVSGSPVTGMGTISISKNTETSNTIYAGPSVDGTGIPSFRSMVASDLPFVPRHEEFAPTSGNTITLSVLPYVVLIVAKNGVVLQQSFVSVGSAALSATAGMAAGNTLTAPASLAATSGLRAVGGSSAIGTLYTVSGQTITFTNAFVSGDHVTVAYAG